MTARVARIAAWWLLLGVRFYQVMLAPLMFSACKFYPSCSHYAVEAIERRRPVARPATGGGPIVAVPSVYAGRARPGARRA